MLLLVSIGILTITGLYFNKEVTFQYGTDIIGKNNFFNIVNQSEKVNINLGNKAIIAVGVMLIVIGLKQVINLSFYKILKA